MTTPSAASLSLISIVIPAYNEEDNVERAYKGVRDVFATLSGYDFEILFCDNASTDDTFARLQALAREDPRVRVVRYARNFGFNRSLLTGYRLAAGDAAIQLDCDLQDPPELFPTFLKMWEQGHDVVVGVRRNRQEGWLLQQARRIFYRLLQRMSDDNIMIDGGDFRLVDRSVLDQLRRIDDADPYPRALTSLLARQQTGVPYDRRVREAGESKYPVRRLFGLAVEGMVAHSVVPLRLASFFGLFVAGICVIVGPLLIFLKLIGLLEGPQGFVSTALLILFGVGMNAIFLGIIGEYLGRIYNQLRYRPATILDTAVNFRAMDVAEAAPEERWRLSMPITTDVHDTAGWPRRRAAETPAHAAERADG